MCLYQKKRWKISENNGNMEEKLKKTEETKSIKQFENVGKQ